MDDLTKYIFNEYFPESINEKVEKMNDQVEQIETDFSKNIEQARQNGYLAALVDLTRWVSDQRKDGKSHISLLDVLQWALDKSK